MSDSHEARIVALPRDGSLIVTRLSVDHRSSGGRTDSKSPYGPHLEADIGRGVPVMDYEGFFNERLDALRAEGRYRAFAGLRPFGHAFVQFMIVWQR